VELVQEIADHLGTPGELQAGGSISAHHLRCLSDHLDEPVGIDSCKLRNHGSLTN
jgi:hypothetical protein